MKLTFLLTAMMLFAFASCGGDKKSNSNNGYFTNSLSTQEGFFNLQTNSLTVNGQTVTPADQQSVMIVNQALNIARNTVQPIMSNNMYGYRARVTGQLLNYNNTMYGNTGYNNGYYGNNNYNTMYGNQVSITSVQFY